MDICLANLTCDNKFSIKNISAEVTFKPIDLIWWKKYKYTSYGRLKKSMLISFFYFQIIHINTGVVTFNSIYFSYNAICWSGSNVVGIFFPFFKLTTQGACEWKKIIHVT